MINLVNFRMEQLKKAIEKWETLNTNYKNDTKEHYQRLCAILRTFWALDMTNNREEIKQSVDILGKTGSSFTIDISKFYDYKIDFFKKLTLVEYKKMTWTVYFINVDYAGKNSFVISLTVFLSNAK